MMCRSWTGPLGNALAVALTPQLDHALALQRLVEFGDRGGDARPGAERDIGRFAFRCAERADRQPGCEQRERRAVDQQAAEDVAHADGAAAGLLGGTILAEVAVVAPGEEHPAGGDPEGDSLAVGSKPRGASPYGALDMAGNVWEWCLERYAPYTSGVVVDPGRARPGAQRMYRGGGWGDKANGCRVANRCACGPGFAGKVLGFRVVLAPAITP